MHRTFYGWASPNSQRASIMLEECGLDYEVRGLNIRKRETHTPDILALNPYGKVPILVEDAQDGSAPLVLFESGAILIHLAETQRMLLPAETRARAETMAWLMVVLTSLGPFSGQAHHWTELSPEKPEVARVHSVGDGRRGCIACWRRGWRRIATSPAMRTRSPMSPPIPGYGAMAGRSSAWRTRPTCCAGSRRWARAPPCSAAWRRHTAHDWNSARSRDQRAFRPFAG